MPRGRKLYFDVALTEGNPSARVAPTLEADRDGGTLDALPALDGNADDGEKERQEITALFVPYHWTGPPPPPAEFTMTDTIPGPPGPFTGPLRLIFSGPVDPASVVLGGSVTIFQNTVPYAGISLEVIANEIRVHNTDGAGDEWTQGGAFMLDLFDTVLEDGTGAPLVPTSANFFFE